MEERGNLDGKNAIVTGSARGIGQSIVKELAYRGANVWACARTQSSEFEEFLGQLSKETGTVIKPVYFDLKSEEEIKSALQGIIKEKKSIDVLVNNAGISSGGLMSMTSIETLRDVFEEN